jgi:putative addiction module killer protein
MTEISIKILEVTPGVSPFEKWYYSIRDKQTRRRILVRLRRLALGNLGDWKSVGNGVFELRLDFGSGYRVYFSCVGKTIVVLLGGGDKSTQQKDIQTAIKVWEKYQNETERFQRDF